MKKSIIFVCAVVLASVLLPCYALAQGTDPPTCCDAGHHSVSPITTQAMNTSQNRVVISDNSLRAMGMSRSDFVDRLAGSLFFGRNVDLVVSISQSVEARSRFFHAAGDPAEESVAAEGILLSVQENRLYQIPRARLRAADIEALDQLSITDGQTRIEIEFTRSASSAASR